MPVIVIGADTALGGRLVERLSAQTAELRVFVSDPQSGAVLRELGCKVAIGDVSDTSHTGAASYGCFSAVLVTEAAEDGRERSFADTSSKVVLGWTEAAKEAGVQRIIWVSDGSINIPDVLGMEVAQVRAGDPDAVELVAAYEDVAILR
jgi:nucleoside-diphosphate-sugar epimerase